MARALALLTKAEIYALVASDLSKVEKELRSYLKCDVRPVTQVSEHLIDSGGKRVRPTLMLLSAGMLGALDARVVRLAAIVESIHNATLIHDDIIDAANTRRGRPSANAVWGKPVALFAGNWLYMQAFAMAIKEDNFEVLQTLIDVTRSMVEGELLQLTLLGKIEVTEKQLMDVIERKTACLFAACTKLPAIAAGVHTSYVARLAEIGTCLGMSFQLIDDLLDLTSTTETLGKPVSSDLAEGKVTLPLQIALSQSGAEAAKKVNTVLQERGFHSVRRQEILDLVQQTDSISYTRTLAKRYLQRAVSAIQSFPSSPYRDALLSIADFIVQRDF
jgi:octaprenyl-diphosphate synthase